MLVFTSCCWLLKFNPPMTEPEELKMSSLLAVLVMAVVFERKDLKESCNSSKPLFLSCTRLGNENGSSSSSNFKEAKKDKGFSETLVLFSWVILLVVVAELASMAEEQLLTTAYRSQFSATTPLTGYNLSPILAHKSTLKLSTNQSSLVLFSEIIGQELKEREAQRTALTFIWAMKQ